MTRPVPACGTKSGYQKHLRDRTPPCQPCKTANAKARREYRDSHPADYAWEQAANRARSRALWRLAKRYDASFRELLTEELNREAAKV